MRYPDGASLIYTTSFDPNNVRTLIHSSLSIHSLLRREIVKHNVIERDKILVPPNWDSWGKIRILREGFELETIGDAWSVEIQNPPEDLSALDPKTHDATKKDSESDSAVAIFETAFPDPALDRSSYRPITDLEAEVTAPDTQTFLTQQAAILEQLRAEDEKADRRTRKGAPAPTGGAHGDMEDNNAGGVANAQMAEHIGPYQINVGGIQVDAEEVTRRIREREASRSSRVASPTKGSSTPVGGDGDDEKGSNEAYKDFFANLIKKGKGGAGDLSPRASPRSSSRAAER
jgi:dynein light intermediate chain 1